MNDLLYKNNMEALAMKKNYYSTNKPSEADYQIEPLRSKDGSIALFFYDKEQKLYLHSKYSPVKEAESLVQNIDFENTKIIAVFGFGLGYHVQQIIRKINRNTKIIILEPSRVIFENAMGLFDCTEIINNSNTYIVVENNDSYKEVLYKIIGYEDISSIYLLIANNYEKAFKREYNKFTECIHDVVREHKYSMNTIEYFSSIWEKNIISNLPALLDSHDVDLLNNAYANIPIIVVSAGPSLSKNIHLLKDIIDKAIIICVGTALRTLLNIGIEPHFVVSIDGGEINFHHFQDISYDNVHLVFSPKSFHEIIKKHKGQKFRFCIDDIILEDILNDLDINATLLDGEASVSTYATSLAIKMGGNPIILIGQDLAYTGNATHASETIFGKDYIKPDKPVISALDVNKNKIFTDQKLLEVKRCLEKIIKSRNHDITFIDATEGGLYIDGTELMTLEQAIDNFIVLQQRLSGKNIKFSFVKEIIDKNRIKELIEKLICHRKSMEVLSENAGHALKLVQQIINDESQNENSISNKMYSLKLLNNSIELEIQKLLILRYSLKALYFRNLNSSYLERLKAVYIDLLSILPEMSKIVEDTIRDLNSLKV